MKQLIELYKEWCGAEPATTEKLPGAGSNRAYYRFTDADGGSVVGCIGTSRDENHAFVYLARHFTMRKLPVPKILAVSSDVLRYLMYVGVLMMLPLIIYKLCHFKEFKSENKHRLVEWGLLILLAILFIIFKG